MRKIKRIAIMLCSVMLIGTAPTIVCNASTGVSEIDGYNEERFQELVTKTSHTPNGTCSLKIQYFS